MEGTASSSRRWLPTSGTFVPERQTERLTELSLRYGAASLQLTPNRRNSRRWFIPRDRRGYYLSRLPIPLDFVTSAPLQLGGAGPSSTPWVARGNQLIYYLSIVSLVKDLAQGLSQCLSEELRQHDGPVWPPFFELVWETPRNLRLPARDGDSARGHSSLILPNASPIDEARGECGVEGRGNNEQLNEEGLSA
ncbi:hypothetical protein BO86DRAFT_117594 [Aspergillus japonicus CBS 114.51]|nr:hypothetical protein BO86DRAFT_117594 [Aspergillus japonicus CBS 114.51]RAH80905.1 hypothetical protein BO86DRAFT_117594 [Aspergillus japonicus CBS 114.51]